MANISIKDVAPILRDVKSITIGWGDLGMVFNRENALDMAAFGDFVIDNIYATGEGEFELNVAVTPIKKGGEVA